MTHSISRTRLSISALAACATLAGCSGDASDGHTLAEWSADGAVTAEQMAALEARLAPGLHALMTELAQRHGSLWFAGDAANWELADHMTHEMEELADRIEETHPEYDDVPVAALLRRMLRPAIDEVEAAIDAADRQRFGAAFDALTRSCNDCHTASGKQAIVIQRPAAPPLSNLRYEP
jgi:hypothetical protein